MAASTGQVQKPYGNYDDGVGLSETARSRDAEIPPASQTHQESGRISRFVTKLFRQPSGEGQSAVKPQSPIALKGKVAQIQTVGRNISDTSIGPVSWGPLKNGRVKVHREDTGSMWRASGELCHVPFTHEQFVISPGEPEETGIPTSEEVGAKRGFCVPNTAQDPMVLLKDGTVKVHCQGSRRTTEASCTVLGTTISHRRTSDNRAKARSLRGEVPQSDVSSLKKRPDGDMTIEPEATCICTAEEVEAERERCVTNTAEYAIATLICDKLLGYQQELSEVVRWQQEVQAANSPKITFKTVLFKHLQSPQADPWLRRFFVNYFRNPLLRYFVYPLIYPLIKRFLDTATKKLVREINRFADHRDVEEKYKNISNMARSVLRRADGFFSTLTDCLEQVQQPSRGGVVVGTLDEEIEKELQVPARNQNLMPGAVYRSVAKSMLGEFFPPLEWVAGIKRGMSKWSPVFRIPLSMIAVVFITPLEAAVGSIFRRLPPLLLRSGKWFERLPQSGLGMIDRNVYSHALNTVLYDQCLSLYRHLQDKEHGTQQSSEGLFLKSDFSPILKHIVFLSQFGDKETIQELRKAWPTTTNDAPKMLLPPLVGGAIAAIWKAVVSVEEEATDLLKTGEEEAINKVAEHLVTVFDPIVPQIFEKNALRRHAHKFFSLANGFYKPNVPVRVEEFIEQEAKLKKMLHDLLQLVVEQAVERFVGADQTEIVDACKTKVMEYIEGVLAWMRKPYMLRYGLLFHQVLLPYIGSHR